MLSYNSYNSGTNQPILMKFSVPYYVVDELQK